jgi:DNA-binding transcriptional LysR family regulator
MSHVREFNEKFRNQGLTIRQLLCLLQLSDSKNQNQAADALGEETSNFSEQLKKLDGLFGPLRDGPKNAKKMNARGFELSRIVSNFVRETIEFQEAFENSNTKQSVIVGAGGSIIEGLVVFNTKDLEDKLLNKVTFTLLSRRDTETADRIQKGQIDFGIVSGRELGPGLEKEPLLSSPTFLAYPKRFKFKSPSDKKELCSKPLAILEGRAKIRTDLKKKVFNVESRPWPEHTLECSSTMQVVSAINSGNYYGFVPEFLVRNLETKKVIVEEYKELGKVEHWMIWKKQTGAARNLSGTDKPLIQELVKAMHKVYGRK